jgi:hypothetical protein
LGDNLEFDTGKQGAIIRPAHRRKIPSTNGRADSPASPAASTKELRSSIDTNIVSALFGGDPSASILAKIILAGLREEGALAAREITSSRENRSGKGADRSRRI